MVNSVIPVTVRIMEKEYRISCPEGEHEALLASAKHVNDNMQKIRESGKALGAERVAVMSALNIANELLLNQSGGVGNEDLLVRIDGIQAMIDESLKLHL